MFSMSYHTSITSNHPRMSQHNQHAIIYLAWHHVHVRTTYQPGSRRRDHTCDWNPRNDFRGKPWPTKNNRGTSTSQHMWMVLQLHDIQVIGFIPFSFCAQGYIFNHLGAGINTLCIPPFNTITRHVQITTDTCPD